VDEGRVAFFAEQSVAEPDAMAHGDFAGERNVAAGKLWLRRPFFSSQVKQIVDSFGRDFRQVQVFSGAAIFRRENQLDKNIL